MAGPPLVRQRPSRQGSQDRGAASTSTAPPACWRYEAARLAADPGWLCRWWASACGFVLKCRREQVSGLFVEGDEKDSVDGSGCRPDGVDRDARGVAWREAVDAGSDRRKGDGPGL